uniref:Uncharacterized protein n=1 Tax=Rhizophora mucronata TaxID=61149 RepID=A0A2P2N9E1_RHIMU
MTLSGDFRYPTDGPDSV